MSDEDPDVDPVPARYYGPSVSNQSGNSGNNETAGKPIPGMPGYRYVGQTFTPRPEHSDASDEL